MGVMTHKNRIISFGGADTSFLSWVAEKDLPEEKETIIKEKYLEDSEFEIPTVEEKKEKRPLLVKKNSWWKFW
jgi:hypothetical protein